jgi:hypothetical protein
MEDWRCNSNILDLGKKMELSGQLRAPAALPSGHRDPRTHFIGGWVGTRTSLVAEEMNKSLCLC